MAAGYQCCVVDPEGDYEGFEGLVGIGTAERAPTVDEVLELLATPTVHVGVSLVAVPLDDRPRFFASLLPRLQEMRSKTGRPHWIVIDEAHHLFPASGNPRRSRYLASWAAVLMITVHPEKISQAMLDAVDMALAVGDAPQQTLKPLGKIPRVVLEDGEVLAWVERQGRASPARPGKAQHRRHRRKYAAGDLAEEAFVFRGPREQAQAPRQNLSIFCRWRKA